VRLFAYVPNLRNVPDRHHNVTVARRADCVNIKAGRIVEIYVLSLILDAAMWALKLDQTSPPFQSSRGDRAGGSMAPAQAGLPGAAAPVAFLAFSCHLAGSKTGHSRVRGGTGIHRSA
jgi:hypothetical protein